ncbi:MAG: hypothetical protein K8J31_06375 [Anaerolineae bacterium]|nr:hypothetical protein [Anaerolineae bacterium]
MEKLREITLPERLPLLLELQPDSNHPSWPYIAQTLFCHSNCYLINMSQLYCRNLLINAAFNNQNHSLNLSEFPTLQEVVVHFKLKLDTFFDDNEAYANLFGPTVKRYYEAFSAFEKPKPCIVRDSYPGMTEGKPLYVIDGMHRLVAFGLRTDLALEYFPIKIYYCTEKLLP